jgi:dTDP-glucose 4,6-dehydratase
MGNERIAVIGANSFSGGHFVGHCLQEGVEVVAISRSPEIDKVFLPYGSAEAAGAAFHQLDLNNDLDELMRLIEDFQPNYVVNFAAQSMVGQSWERPGDWFRTNTLSTVLFHDRLRKCRFIDKYVHISTPEVYGSCSGIVPESRSYTPSTPYAVSRAAADMSLTSFHEAYGFPVVFTRAANVFGPCQQLYRIIPRTILYFLTGKKLQLHGGGTSVRSFIHMADVATGTLLAARKGPPGEIYHFSTPRNISIRALVELIAKQMDIDFSSSVEVAPDRLGKDSAYLLDSSKAAKELGWSAKVSLEEGIEQTIDWVKSNLNELLQQPMNYVHKP